MTNPLVTFITVVFNGVNELEETIKSVLSQTDKRFEYFIVDGGSTDGTVDLIRKHESQLAGWISEKDNGLYDAMNKGMKMGSGKYLWFMNAGDQLFSSKTLENIFIALDKNQWPGAGNQVSRAKNHEPGKASHFPDVIYGETEIMNAKGESVGLRRLKAPEKLNWRSLQWGMVVCHQSFLVKRENCLPYNSEFRLVSDIDWMIRVLKNSNDIFNSHLILCRFKAGGLSHRNISSGLKERFKIMVHHYGFTKTVTNHFVLGTKLFFYYLRHRRI